MVVKENPVSLREETIAAVSIWLNLQQTKKNSGQKEYEKEVERVFTELFPSHNQSKKIGRNEKCPCGSGKKYKKCCLEKESESDEVPFDFKEKLLEKVLNNLPRTKEDFEAINAEVLQEILGFSQIPSASMLLRHKRHNINELINSTMEYSKTEEFPAQMEKLRSLNIKKKPLEEKAEKTGDWKTAFFEAGSLTGKKRALGTQYNILARQFKGFELFLNENFFKEKCKNCSRKNKEVVECEKGHSECLFNEEYEEFTEDYVKNIVVQLKQGKQPIELDIPERLSDLEKKLQSAINPIIKSFKKNVE